MNMSDITPPTIVENTEHEMPAIARVTRSSEKDAVTAEPIYEMQYTTPATRNTSLRPRNSEKGARIIGARAKHKVKVVIPA